MPTCVKCKKNDCSYKLCHPCQYNLPDDVCSQSECFRASSQNCGVCNSRICYNIYSCCYEHHCNDVLYNEPVVIICAKCYISNYTDETCNKCKDSKSKNVCKEQILSYQNC
jgi:hypothetical protein